MSFGGYFYTYRVSPENDGPHLDLTFSIQERSYARPIGIGAAAALIVLIILTMTTTLASKILPMSDEYLLVMIPPAPDGAEPLALNSLRHEIDGKTISVSGSVMNRTAVSISNVLAVVEMQDTTGRFPQTQEVPVQPEELAPQAVGTFMAMATLEENPAGDIYPVLYTRRGGVSAEHDLPPHPLHDFRTRDHEREVVEALEGILL